MSKIISSFLNSSSVTSESYKAGYNDRKKEDEERLKAANIAIAQLNSLGYMVGEPINVIKAAFQIKQNCVEQVNCDKCPFLGKSDGCILKGQSPAEWPVH